MAQVSKTTPTHARGFSLLELMFVIIIIGVLASVVGYNLLGAAEKAKQSATMTSMGVVKNALNTYRATYNAYPETGLGLRVLVADKLIEKFPKDGWNKDLEYYSPIQEFPNGFELISSGPDLTSGTADDLRLTPDAQ